MGGDAAAFHDEPRDRLAPAARDRPPRGATPIVLFLLTGSLTAPVLPLAVNALTLAAAFGILILILQDGRFEFLLSYTSQGGLDLTISLVLAALADHR